MKRLIVLSLVVVALSGCTTARHSQCQDLASQADGAAVGAAMSGTYYGQMQANIAQRQYERCETAFDVVDSARGSQVASQPVQRSYPQPTEKDSQFIGLKGEQVAFTSNGELVVISTSQSYQFVKASPVMSAPKDDKDTGVKQGDSVQMELFANNAR